LAHEFLEAEIGAVRVGIVGRDDLRRRRLWNQVGGGLAVRE
jgi:hypothetical protein